MKQKGLTEKEARKRLEKYGFNEIQELGKISLFRILFRQIRSNFIIYLLLFAMILSFFVGKSMTAYVILGVIFIVILTGFFQEYKAEKAIEKLKEMVMPISIIIRDGTEQEIPTKEVVPGDILVLRTGEKIPADCAIISDKNLLVNESILTGESDELKKFSAKNLDDISKENQIFAGTFIVNGKCTAIVEKTGMNTKFGKIAGLISSAEKELPLQKKVNAIVRYMTIFGGSFAILTGLIMLLRTPGFDNNLLIDALIIVIAVAVASFPEGFPVVLITTLSMGAYKMAKKNAIVNRMSIIETLGETTVICSDKTGTITKGEMTVKKIFADNSIIDVSGTGYEGKGDFVLDKIKLEPSKEKVLNLLLKSSVMCNDANIKREGEDKTFSVFGMPTEVALLVMASKANIYREDFGERLDEIPFSSERKTMSVLYKEGSKKMIYSKGALEYILKNCKYIQRNDMVFRLSERDKKRILSEAKKMTYNSLRTLAIAYKETKLNNIKEEDLVFLGIVGMEDPPREGVKEALEICRKAGIKIKMITGDDRETALSIAKQINLGSGKIFEGFEIDSLSQEELVKVVKSAVIFARVKPEHKLRIVQALKENGEIVTMTGDGVNDAPALKEAHIGVAMGKNGTDVSRSVADLTLKDDNFVTLVDTIKEGRTIFTNIQKFSTYQISVNFSQVALIFLAILIGFPAPLIPIQILFMNLFSDEITAITLAFNPYSKDVMDLKPRRKSQIITKSLLLMLVCSGLIMSLGSLGVFYYTLSIGKEEVAARTVTFLTMVFFGLTNAFNFRSFRKTTIGRSPFTNKPLVFASLFAILSILIIVYTPVRVLLDVIPIKPIFWLIAISVSFSVIIVFDILKKLNHKKDFLKLD